MKNTSLTPSPEGFAPIQLGGAFLHHLGPFYGRWTGHRLLLGFRVESRHLNGISFCHGGMLATFADMLVPTCAIYQMTGDRRITPTVTLGIDYLAPAAAGAWIEGEADLLRETKSLIFGQGLIRADGEIVARLNGIYKLANLRGDGKNDDPFNLKTGS